MGVILKMGARATRSALYRLRVFVGHTVHPLATIMMTRGY